MNADVNAKNCLTKEDATKDLLGILVIVIVNVINQVMLENIWIIKTVNVEENLVDELVEKCSKNVDGNRIIYNGTLNGYKNVCNSCTVYIVLLIIFFIISLSIGSVFIYFH